MTDRRARLVGTIGSFTSDVHAVAIAAKLDAVITTGDDRALKIWWKRDSRGYWPSVLQPLPSEGICLDYHAEKSKLFVGLNNGQIQEYIVSDDCNKLTQVRTYSAHEGRVTCVLYSQQCEWLLSCARDKYFTWHCCETGARLGSYQCTAWCTCVRFDDKSRYAFVADYSGVITVLKLPGAAASGAPSTSAASARGEAQFVVALRGHSGSVRCLAWDSERRMLFSGSFDQSIIVWDIGGQKGSAFELQGHNDKVQALCYSPRTKVLLSAASDQKLVAWPMDVRRIETPAWLDSDVCQKCNAPFFWNWRTAWEEKRVGVRQHHCRKCGKAVCDTCSSHRSTLPILGFENEVRMCSDCFKEIRPEDRVPLCTVFDTSQTVVAMWLDEPRGLLATVGSDRIIKIWDAAALLAA